MIAAQLTYARTATVPAASTQAALVAIVRLHCDGGPRWGKFRYALHRSEWIQSREQRGLVRWLLACCSMSPRN